MVEKTDQLGFTIDTHLLRELGKLLVGRDSTALVELIKNAYDADATHVTVHGEGVGGEHGSITVSDDGSGMTFDRFQDAFLRIAGRTKELGKRESPGYRRRYTGAKGIGRLAAHKLAANLEVDSIPRFKGELTGDTDDTTRCGVSAQLHWDRMEDERTDLTMLGDTLTASRLPVLPNSTPGTTLRLDDTREAWDGTRLGNFLREVRYCRPSQLLVQRPSSAVLRDRLLLDDLHVADHAADDPGFILDLTGDFDGGEGLWQTLSERASWVVEIDSSSKALRYGVAPTQRSLKTKQARDVSADLLAPRVFQTRHPYPETGPFFQARILVTTGSFGTRGSDLAQFARQESGIRVFMEGFRVLPYGGERDDWLGLDRAVVNKQRTLEIDPRLSQDRLTEVDNEGFYLLPNRSYFGAVVLTEAGSSELDMVVNREGFVPNEAFERLCDLVRTGLDLCVRARAGFEREVSTARAKEKERDKSEKAEEARKAAEASAAAARSAADNSAGDDGADDGAGDVAYSDGGTGRRSTVESGEKAHDPDDNRDDNRGSDYVSGTGDGPAEDPLTDLIAAANAAADQLDNDLPAPQRHQRTEQLRATFAVVTQRFAAIHDEELILRTLAGLGMQYTAFVHEVNGLLGSAQHLRAMLDDLVAASPVRGGLPGLKDARVAADELVQSLTRQASYLSDVVGPDARRRRRRMPVVERVESAMRLLSPQLNERKQSLHVDVAAEVQTPPIFPAEFGIVMTNLLTNAIKFAGDEGRIRVAAETDRDGQLHVLVENTGDVVARVDRERFFKVFQSSTIDVDAVLGQGMGMGLPIVRSLLASYDGTAEFVDPSKGYSTAVEVVLPDPQHRRRRAAA